MKVGTLLSCQPYTITPGAEKVRIFEAEPKGCLFMGEVSETQDNDDVFYTGADIDMSLKTGIELRNKAFKHNANVLVFTPRSTANLAKAMPATAEKKDKSSDGKADPKSDVVPEPQKSALELAKPAHTVFLGTVFRCPPLIFNQ
ncbi:MAG: DUF4156 domain-containing protein [Bdellovibrio sp.]|nr:DUF4156 domain-containing protein [Bdellovibrio sp.]